MKYFISILFLLVISCKSRINNDSVKIFETTPIDVDSLKGLLRKLSLNDTIILYSNNKREEDMQNSFGYSETYLIYYFKSNCILIKHKTSNQTDSICLTKNIAKIFYDLEKSLNIENFICSDCEQTWIYFNREFIAQSDISNKNIDASKRQLINFYLFKHAFQTINETN